MTILELFKKSTNKRSYYKDLEKLALEGITVEDYKKYKSMFDKPSIYLGENNLVFSYILLLEVPNASNQNALNSAKENEKLNIFFRWLIDYDYDTYKKDFDNLVDEFCGKDISQDFIHYWLDDFLKKQLPIRDKLCKLIQVVNLFGTNVVRNIQINNQNFSSILRDINSNARIFDDYFMFKIDQIYYNQINGLWNVIQNNKGSFDISFKPDIEKLKQANRYFR